MTISEIDQAKEVIMYEEFDGCEDNGKPIERIFYGCPICGATAIPYQDRCHKCEQTLKW